MKSTYALAAAVVALAASPGLAMAQVTSDAALIEEGRRLFLEETFGGNGRTCASCHAAENNFTVDADFLRTVPGNDPVFTAAPQLRGALGDLEVINRLRQDALFCENVDGLNEICVLRSAPHTLALRTSLRPRAPFPHADATGWSGDGSPGDGSLRSFAIGAIIQHLPKSMNRVPGVDFRLPTDEELAAMEAFQLSLGRQADPNIVPGHEDAIVFADETVEDGKVLFHAAPSRSGGTRSCAACHANGGANNASGENRNFDTGVALLPTAPACRGGFEAPGDGGLGASPPETIARRDLCGNGPTDGPKAELTFRGSGTFNTPPAIEAADTGPWFHNNAVAGQIEDAIRFYNSDTFNVSPAGGNNAFALDGGQVNAVGALLRALNAKMNVEDMALRYLADALATDDAAWAGEAVFLASVEIEDAIEVLTAGPVALFAGTDAVPLLREALELTRQAQAAGADADLIEEAVATLEAARDEMVE
jgi:cytochrome c peroxidase